MTDEQKEILDIKFPKELPKGHTDTEKLTQARWRIAQLEKMLDERKAADTVRRQFWVDMYMIYAEGGWEPFQAREGATKVIAHYDKTFYGH